MKRGCCRSSTKVTWNMPASPRSLRSLSSRRIVAGLERLLDRPAYNYLVHSGPMPGAENLGAVAVGSGPEKFDAGATKSYHWHVEVFPRVTTLAGFELGTGCIINSVAPERAAEKLRWTVEC